MKQGWTAESRPALNYDYGIPLLSMDIPSFLRSHLPKTERLFYFRFSFNDIFNLCPLLIGNAWRINYNIHLTG